RKLKLPLLGQADPNLLENLHMVGRYALGVDWADHHGSIYPFERLRQDCPCGICGEATATSAMAWPAEITRTPAGRRVVWSDRHESLYPYAELRALCRCAGCTGGH